MRVYVQYNPLKVYFIKEKIADGGSSTVYRCGPLIDLCLGPHVANTNRIKAFAVYKVRVSRGRGNSGMPEGTAVVPASRRPIHSCLVVLAKSAASATNAALALVLAGQGRKRAADARVRHLVP